MRLEENARIFPFLLVRLCCSSRYVAHLVFYLLFPSRLVICASRNELICFISEFSLASIPSFRCNPEKKGDSEVSAFCYKPELFAAVFVCCNTNKAFRLLLHSGEEEARNLLVEARYAFVCMCFFFSLPSLTIRRRLFLFIYLNHLGPTGGPQ